MSDEALDPVDREALGRAVALTLAESSDRGAQVEALMKQNGWRDTAEFCAHHLQAISLALRPWEQPPASGGTPEANELAARLRAHGVSIFDPRPLEALAKAQRPKPAKPRAKRRRLAQN